MALDLSDLSKTFGGVVAVAGITLHVPRRQRLAVIGPNGAGKTTLFHLISGEIPATSGSVRLFGQDVTRLAAHRRVALGLRRTYQITNLFPALSVDQNAMLALYGLRPSKFDLLRPIARGGALAQEAQRALARVGLADRGGMAARELSHGEQRQLELALALASAPRLLLLDEPAAGLSSAERGVMAEIIRGLPGDLTVILIEHDMDLALSLAERVVCLHNGRMIGEGAPHEIRHNQAVQEVYLGIPAGLRSSSGLAG